MYILQYQYVAGIIIINNLYFIESPLQLLSAIESKKEFDGKNYLFVNANRKTRKNNYDQIKSLIGNDEWKGVYFFNNFDSKLTSHLYYFLFAIKIFFKFRFSECRTFNGDFRNYYFNIFTHVLNPHLEILLDDGAVTLTIQNKYFKNGINFESYLRKKSDNFIKVYNFYKYVFKIKNRDNRPPDLYTLFDLEKSLFRGQRNYRKKSSKLKKEFDDTSIFFGSHYSESSIISEENEIKLLVKVFDVFKENDKQFLYIPHREESKKKIKLIRDIGYEVLTINKPAEVYFYLLEKSPHVIVGFYTTALYSLNTLFELNYVYYVDLRSYLQKNMNSDLDLIYETYEHNGIINLKI